MISMVDFSYDERGITDIKEWGFGENWPVVYIIYSDTKAYVGETLNAARRTEQHLKEPEFNKFSSICLISDKTFNKSVILDLESFLIKYMSADGTRMLTNVNSGIVDHNYFYREAYVDDFKAIWAELMKRGIVRRSILNIENSELFKYSPYKVLSSEQKRTLHVILEQLKKINKDQKESGIIVRGGAGTGKTILAVYLMKLIIDISANRKVWDAIEDSSEIFYLRNRSKELAGIKKIGFVVPMNELRNTMKTIFESIDGLTDEMVLAPEDVVKEEYDILVVDEAHRLYRRKNLSGVQMYKKFDAINRVLMADRFTGSEEDFTELDWIIKHSKMQILFYDEFQTIRASDIGRERFKIICRPHLYKYIDLFSQMRCKGGNGYYEYVKNVIEKYNINIREYKKIVDYELKVVDNVEDIFAIIQQKNETDNLCRVVTGPGWGMKQDIVISGKKFHWARNIEESNDSAILSIHKIQGFDLNYAGVIFGKEVYYDDEAKCIAVNKKELKDNFTKSSGEDDMRRFVLNIYITLMTRGINGTYVYAVDDRLRYYLRQFFN